jgi:hypothetical protein
MAARTAEDLYVYELTNWIMDHEVANMLEGAGRLRLADIRQRVGYIVESWPKLHDEQGRPYGRPATERDGYAIALEAVAQSYGTEAASETGWDCAVAVHIAFSLLGDANCHIEAAALREAATRMGAW